MHAMYIDECLGSRIHSWMHGEMDLETVEGLLKEVLLSSAFKTVL